MMDPMSVDRSIVRVKAMLVVPSADGSHHLVSANGRTRENPLGFHRLIGGSVELGETFEQAIIREIDEELGASIIDLTQLGVVESIFTYEGALGHEVVAVFAGRLDPEPPKGGGTLTESDGTVVPVLWRSLSDDDVEIPLYPAAARDLVSAAMS